MNSPLRFPARVAMKYARGSPTSRQPMVPAAAIHRLSMNGSGLLNARM